VLVYDVYAAVCCRVILVGVVVVLSLYFLNYITAVVVCINVYLFQRKSSIVVFAVVRAVVSIWL